MAQNIEKIVRQFKELERLGKIEGIYDDISDEVYNHPDFPGIRSSFLKEVIKKSVYHASKSQAEMKVEKQHFRDGRILHSFMEGVPEPEIRKKFNLMVMEAQPFREMKNSILSHPRIAEVYRNSYKEITMFAICRYTGLLLRCRCDVWNPSNGLITDYKTAEDASPEGFERAARRMKYRISACFYGAVANWATKQVVEEFRLFAVEKSAPYFCAQYFYTSESFELDTHLMIRGLKQIQLARQDGAQGYPTEVMELRY